MSDEVDHWEMLARAALDEADPDDPTGEAARRWIALTAAAIEVQIDYLVKRGASRENAEAIVLSRVRERTW